MFGPGNGIGTDYEGGKQVPELPPTLCRLDPRDGSLRVVADNFAGPNGLCFSPDGTLLGRIKVPFTVANLAFGGRNRARLLICASHTLYVIYTNTRGAERP